MLQNRQASILLNQLDKETGVVIIGCDCNSYETSSSYRILKQSMSNSTRELGWVINKSNDYPGVSPEWGLQHIDYVWYRGLLNPVGVYKVSDSGGSDHFPVLAVFRWN
jgi:endonuclease/exonuclease/phosphatase (EEP) superfamily protein YafD